MATSPKQRNYFGIPRALGLSLLTGFARNISATTRAMLHPAPSKRQETFAEAMVRLNLTEADVQKRTQEFLYLALGFLAATLLVLAYTVYLFWHAHIAAGILGFIVSVMISTQAFRYHFWHFQMKKRKLGCTIKEWLLS